MTPDIKYRKQNFLNSISALRRRSEDLTETASETDEKWFLNYGRVTTRYLQQVYSINTIKGFAHELNFANSHHVLSERMHNISFRTIDAIVDSCEKWRPYLLDQESFDLLVCLEVLSMAEIHASVISARNFAEHQGTQGVRLKEDVSLPYMFTTVVSRYGLLQVFS